MWYRWQLRSAWQLLCTTRYVVLRTDTNQMLFWLEQVTLIYHKKLDHDWTAAAQKLRTSLAEAPSSSEAAIPIIGRSHKQVLSFSVELFSAAEPGLIAIHGNI